MNSKTYLSKQATITWYIAALLIVSSLLGAMFWTKPLTELINICFIALISLLIFAAYKQRNITFATSVIRKYRFVLQVLLQQLTVFMVSLWFMANVIWHSQVNYRLIPLFHQQLANSITTKSFTLLCLPWLIATAIIVTFSHRKFILQHSKVCLPSSIFTRKTHYPWSFLYNMAIVVSSYSHTFVITSLFAIATVSCIEHLAAASALASPMMVATIVMLLLLGNKLFYQGFLILSKRNYDLIKSFLSYWAIVGTVIYCLAQYILPAVPDLQMDSVIASHVTDITPRLQLLWIGWLSVVASITYHNSKNCHGQSVFSICCTMLSLPCLLAAALFYYQLDISAVCLLLTTPLANFVMLGFVIWLFKRRYANVYSTAGLLRLERSTATPKLSVDMVVKVCWLYTAILAGYYMFGWLLLQVCATATVLALLLVAISALVMTKLPIKRISRAASIESIS